MKTQSGISLIEVMVAVMILGFGLLGLAALQPKMLVMAQSSHYRGIATDLAADLADRIRANRTPFFGSNDDGTVQADLPLPADFSACVQATNKDDPPTCVGAATGRNAYLRDSEMQEWNTALRRQLPNASYTLASESVANNAFYRYTLTITWLDDRYTSTDATFTTVIE